MTVALRVRRRHPRYEVSVPLHLTTPDLELDVLGRNISAGGVFVHGGFLEPAGTTVCVSVTLAGETFSLSGSIARVQHYEVDTPPGMAIQFHHIDKAARLVEHLRDDGDTPPRHSGTFARRQSKPEKG